MPFLDMESAFYKPRSVRGLVADYKGERERGYAAGLRAAEIIGFKGLNKFAGSEDKFDGLFGPGGWPDSDEYDDHALWDAETDELSEIGTKLSDSTTFRDGALQAFNDLWMRLQSSIEEEEGVELEATGDFEELKRRIDEGTYE